MICEYCGENIGPLARFCPKCGRAVKASDYTRQSTPYQILAHSASCKSRLDEWKKRLSGFVNGVCISASIPFFFVMAFLLADKIEFSDIPWLFLIIYGVGIWVAIFIVIKKLKAANELYILYDGYCNTEGLVVDTEKISGSSKSGRLTLRYEEIQNVDLEIIPTTQNVYIFSNDRLKITDIAGNCYVFFSFSNGQELRTVIDAQIQKLRENR